MPIRRKRWLRFLAGATITVVVILTIVSLPIWLPLVSISLMLEERRMKHAARQFACLRCGKILGVEALRLSDQQHAADMRELRLKHPGVRFRIVRIGRATCTQCGARYRWDEKQRTFTLVADSETPAANSPSQNASQFEKGTME
jgi:hypothetical protein